MTGGRVSEIRNLMAVVTDSLLDECQYVCVMEDVGREGGVEEIDIEGGVGVLRRLRGKMGTEGHMGYVEVGIGGCEEVGIENTEGGI